MRLELLRPDDVKVGMWIEGDDGMWWRIYAVVPGRRRFCWKSFHPVSGRVELHGERDYAKECRVLVGIKD